MNAEKLNQLISTLDKESKTLLSYMYKKQHANIRELSDVIAAKSDSYTLMKINEVINPAAGEIIGKKILRFKDNNIDFTSGEKVLFSWWLDKNLAFNEKMEMIDVFDEETIIRVVAELPEGNGSVPEVCLRESVLELSAGKYDKLIPLPVPAREIASKSYKNNVLEVKLLK